MEIDVIILSYARNETIIQMNNTCIDSINSSTNKHKFNIILIETDVSKNHSYHQKNVTVIQPNIEFNYNRFLNIGLEYCKNNWILITNNDTIYHPNFIENMLYANENDNELMSMSCIDDDWFRHVNFNRNVPVHYGHNVGLELTGWCIFLNKEIIKTIGKFDERFTFWYQDDDYSRNLIKHNLKHGLISNAKVTHLLSKSHDFIESSKKYNMTDGVFKIFYDKWVNLH